MSQPLDPAGHLKLAVSNYKESHKFYATLFSLLKFKQIAEKEQSSAWVTAEGFGIWIAQAKKTEPKHVFAAPGFHHLCFKASSEKEVDKVYASMKKIATIIDQPQKYPKYTDKYYAVFISDPDGMKIEVAYY